MGTDPGVVVTEPSPGTYLFKGSTTGKVGSWLDLISVVHLEAGTYTLDASDWPLGSNSWAFGVQASLTPDTGGEHIPFANPADYGPKTLPAGTLSTNIFVDTTGEVDITFAPRLYKID